MKCMSFEIADIRERILKLSFKQKIYLNKDA